MASSFLKISHIWVNEQIHECLLRAMRLLQVTCFVKRLPCPTQCCCVPRKGVTSKCDPCTTAGLTPELSRFLHILHSCSGDRPLNSTCMITQIGTMLSCDPTQRAYHVSHWCNFAFIRIPARSFTTDVIRTRVWCFPQRSGSPVRRGLVRKTRSNYSPGRMHWIFLGFSSVPRLLLSRRF